jgi:hypothetical protein
MPVFFPLLDANIFVAILVNYRNTIRLMLRKGTTDKSWKRAKYGGRIHLHITTGGLAKNMIRVKFTSIRHIVGNRDFVVGWHLLCYIK